MLKAKDGDGRIPLTGREYNALRCMMVALNEVDVCHDTLRDRMRVIPYGWRDLRMILVRLGKLLDDVYATIPIKKLQALKTEINNSKIVLTIRGADDRCPKGVVYVDEQALISMMDRLVAQDCWCCDKTGKDVKRCAIRQIILDVLHYDSDLPDDKCDLRGCATVLKEE